MMKRTLWAPLALLAATGVWAAGETIEINPPAEGSVSTEEGLAAWGRIYEVASHPRCANCHTGESDRPMWSGPSYGKARPHGMNIRAGESRIGAEHILCSTCHTTKDEDWSNANAVPHAAPRVAAEWQLAPVEADWFGRSSVEICRQLRDPERNGDRDMLELAAHLDHDLILHWAWAPGGGREPAPYSLQEHVNDILTWGVAGMPCPEN
ncbi:hypothetical protein PSA7680_01522 [Pseudoruegeria aquimaris]|uniref:Uncharacterized protein n=1 Tax=Pseudoruegeria aquimaris TaxID=393663 RepID=A0A1Y5S7F4_9RHOB|nr:hypothetical protein [Pseudoruegeria aquimaris]SLN31548.1 hypothetical protein PSA7680_01522 [Pseudoruegeria aquimaris]